MVNEYWRTRELGPLFKSQCTRPRTHCPMKCTKCRNYFNCYWGCTFFRLFFWIHIKFMFYPCYFSRGMVKGNVMWVEDNNTTIHLFPLQVRSCPPDGWNILHRGWDCEWLELEVGVWIISRWVSMGQAVRGTEYRPILDVRGSNTSWHVDMIRLIENFPWQRQQEYNCWKISH